MAKAEDNKGTGDNEGAGEAVTVESLQAQLEEAQSQIASVTAEAAKHRGKLKTVVAERDELKKLTKKAPGVDDEGNDYKSLYAQEQSARGKLLEKVKSSDIRSAAQQRLTKLNVLPEAMDLAIQSLDKGLIEWSEDDGVDDASVNAAIAKLKNAHPFIFEKTVNRTKVGNPGSGSSGGNGDEKIMSRTEYRKLQQSNPALLSKRFSEGWKLADRQEGE